MRKLEVVSFDIFDTCILRSCGTSKNFLDVLSYYVFTKQVDELTRQKFIISRKRAEIKSYSIDATTNIYDIYSHFNFNNPYLKKIEDIISIEIELEGKVTVPVLYIKEKIKKYRMSGKKILFISDMYLPSNLLKKILIKHSLFEEGDSIYVSCDSGFSKKDGSLYKYIKKKENIVYEKWIHYGDNKMADYFSPRKLGIEAKLIINQHSKYGDFLNQQQDTYTYDYRSALAGLSKALIYSEPFHLRNKLIIDIIAPLYCSFVNCIFENATKKGISKIFFCARDCFQLFQAAKIFNKAYPNITIKYLYISRESLRKTPQETLLSFFIQEGLATNDYYSAIVDATTTGKTQSLINNLLDSYGYNKIYSYSIIKYDYLDNNIFDNKYDNYSISYCSQLYSQDSMTKSHIFNNKVVAPMIESIFSANIDKKTIGYSKNDNTILPVFSENETNEECVQQRIEELQQTHTHLISTYAQHYLNINLSPFSSLILTNISYPLINTFINIPIKDYTEGLLDCKIIVNNHEIALIKKQSIISTIIKKGKDTFWDRATVLYNLPNFLSKLFIKKRLM